MEKKADTGKRDILESEVEEVRNRSKRNNFELYDEMPNFAFEMAPCCPRLRIADLFLLLFQFGVVEDARVL